MTEKTPNKKLVELVDKLPPHVQAAYEQLANYIMYDYMMNNMIDEVVERTKKYLEYAADATVIQNCLKISMVLKREHMLVPAFDIVEALMNENIKLYDTYFTYFDHSYNWQAPKIVEEAAE